MNTTEQNEKLLQDIADLEKKLATSERHIRDLKKLLNMKEGRMRDLMGSAEHYQKQGYHAHRDRMVSIWWANWEHAREEKRAKFKPYELDPDLLD